MSETAPAVVEKPVIKVEDSKPTDIPITTPALDNANVAGAIASNLNKIGHSISAEDVSAHGSSNAVLAGIEKEGIGAKVVDVLDPLNKLVENTTGDVIGSHRTYVLSGGAGLQKTHERMIKRVGLERVPKVVSNLLSRFKKK